MIDDVEHNALTAMVHAGVRRAAAQLSQLTKEQIALSTPTVIVIPHQKVVELLPLSGAMPLVAVREQFSGRFSGSALLLFPETKSLGIVKAAVGDRTRIEEIEELEPEAQTEIGNILLNGCLSVLANNLRQTLNISAPELLRGTGQVLLGADHRHMDTPVLFVQVNFSVHRYCIEGYITLIMDLPALQELKICLRAMIDSTDSAHTTAESL
ncbi:hypothetical protein [Azospirillum brasilense]|uniref:Chemotaxis protein CheC n=1 Tax=Azospirillum brasilense TaxID=192 RepID=A0A235H4Y7_AZOBR|nr:hypothetical protein [Azospirillum brasilense]OYD80285.1 hypothetical protein CHT98_32025 [Azospirillum brasilense]